MKRKRIRRMPQNTIKNQWRPGPISDGQRAVPSGLKSFEVYLDREGINQKALRLFFI